MNESTFVLFAFLYEALKTKGIENSSAIDFISLAISQGIVAFSTTQGPANRKKPFLSVFARKDKLSDIHFFNYQISTDGSNSLAHS